MITGRNYEMILLLEDFFGNWPYETSQMFNQNWLVVSTPLKHISQNGNLPQIGVKIKHIWNHHLENNATLVTGLGLVVAHIRMIIGCWSLLVCLHAWKLHQFRHTSRTPKCFFLLFCYLGSLHFLKPRHFICEGTPKYNLHRNFEL